jgi:hypothetical protein
MISSRNKNQTKEEKKPPEKKTLTSESFLSFSLCCSFPFFSFTYQEEGTQTKTRTSLCPSPHGVQSFTALGRKQTLTFDLFRRSTKKHKFVRSFVRSFM